MKAKAHAGPSKAGEPVKGWEARPKAGRPVKGWRARPVIRLIAPSEGQKAHPEAKQKARPW